MIQGIGFTHDLGHPPFGHGGEVALNYCMRKDGGFEGNGQTLRILSKLEKFSAEHGADLTRRTLLGTLKYPVPFSRVNNPQIIPGLVGGTSTLELVARKSPKPPKCYMNSEQDVVDWILKPLTERDRTMFTSVEPVNGKHGKALHKSFDCSIVDLADDIAFGVHDLEDSLALKLINEDDFRLHVPEGVYASHLDALKQTYPNEFGNDVYAGLVRMLFGNSRTRKHAISRMVGHFIPNCVIETIDEIEEPMIRYRAGMRSGPRLFLDALKKVVYDVVILSPAVQHLEFKGQRMVIAVFEVFQSEPKAFLPRDTFEIYRTSTEPVRVISDHISGMTDAFLLKTYDRLCSPRMGSVFDKL